LEHEFLSLRSCANVVPLSVGASKSCNVVMKCTRWIHARHCKTLRAAGRPPHPKQQTTIQQQLSGSNVVCRTPRLHGGLSTEAHRGGKAKMRNMAERSLFRALFAGRCPSSENEGHRLPAPISEGQLPLAPVRR
jgi:hypothetical protein